jgi:hypothetical protein
VHSCSDDYVPYHHYEHGGSEGGTQLHVIGISAPTSALPGNDGYEHHPVAVQVNRPGRSVLVLSARWATEWNVEVADGATVEGIITFGHVTNRVNAPDGVPVLAYSWYEDDVNPGDAPMQWPSYGATELVDTAELLTGLELTSFRGCGDSNSFQIDEPGALRPPHTVSSSPDPRAIPGCESLTAESGYCMAVDHGLGLIADVVMVGLDSGTTCGRFSLGDAWETGYSSSLGWAGDYVYRCMSDRGVARTSLIDGSVDIAPVVCDTVTAHGDGLIAMVSFAARGFEDAPLFLARFASFEDAVKVTPEQVYEFAPSSRGSVAALGNHLYFVADDYVSVDVAELTDGAAFENIALEGFGEFGDFINGLDVTEDGKMVVLLDTYETHGPHIFDAATGAYEGSLANPFGSYALGLECFSNATAE